MQPGFESVDSFERRISDFIRLRRKHPPRSEQARSYRVAIRQQLQQLRAFRLATKANADLLVIPKRKKKPTSPAESS